MRWLPGIAVVLLTTGAGCEAPRDDAARVPWLQYRVRAAPLGRELTIEATLDGCASTRLVVGPDVSAFVRHAEVMIDGAWRELKAAGDAFVAPPAATLHVRYEFDLAAAARALDDVGVAAQREGMLLAPPSTWLLRPAEVGAGCRASIAVACPDGTEFASALPRQSDAHRYQAAASDLGQLPYAAFGAMRRHHVACGNAEIDVAIADVSLAVDDAAVTRWVADAAHAVASYFERLPVARPLVLIVPVDGDQVMSGSTMGNGGAATIIYLGRKTRTLGIDSDWVLTHELVHLALPTIARRQLWLAEGIATYVEPLVRAHAGALAGARVWRDLVRDLPQGLPRAHDRGLDHTATWGRTYWGGALFCLLADVAIRERTANRFSLRDALLGILQNAGNIAVRSDIDTVIATGDRATHTTVLSELYHQMAEAPLATDLEVLWTKLGIARRGGRLQFDDRAPLASIRKSITEVKG